LELGEVDPKDYPVSRKMDEFRQYVKSVRACASTAESLEHTRTLVPTDGVEPTAPVSLKKMESDLRMETALRYNHQIELAVARLSLHVSRPPPVPPSVWPVVAVTAEDVRSREEQERVIAQVRLGATRSPSKLPAEPVVSSMSPGASLSSSSSSSARSTVHPGLSGLSGMPMAPKKEPTSLPPEGSPSLGSAIHTAPSVVVERKREAPRRAPARRLSYVDILLSRSGGTPPLWK